MALVNPHYIWATGHVIMLTGALYVLLQTVLFRPTPTYVYKASFIGALLSYSVVVFKSLGVPKLDIAWARRAFLDENVQYALLALYWSLTKPVALAIVPFATFSLFHCLTFLRTTIIPKLVPPQQAGQSAQARPPPGLLENVSRTMQVWVKGNYDGAMRFVAYVELALLLRLALGAVTLRSSLLAPIIVAHFIRLRSHASPFTKQAISTLTARADSYILPRGGIVAKVWQTVKGVAATWAASERVNPPAPAPGGAAGGSGGTARPGPTAARATAERR